MKPIRILPLILAGVFATTAVIAQDRDRTRDQTQDTTGDKSRDQTRDQTRDPALDQTRDRTRDQIRDTDIYGYQLMTTAERNTYRSRMVAAKTVQEREQIRTEHHELMKVRAKERGVNLPDPPPMGQGPGPGPAAPAAK
jgi:hypothetical protein